MKTGWTEWKGIAYMTVKRAKCEALSCQARIGAASGFCVQVQEEDGKLYVYCVETECYLCKKKQFMPFAFGSAGAAAQAFLYNFPWLIGVGVVPFEKVKRFFD